MSTLSLSVSSSQVWRMAVTRQFCASSNSYYIQCYNAIVHHTKLESTIQSKSVSYHGTQCSTLLDRVERTSLHQTLVQRSIPYHIMFFCTCSGLMLRLLMHLGIFLCVLTSPNCSKLLSYHVVLYLIMLYSVAADASRCTPVYADPSRCSIVHSTCLLLQIPGSY